MRLILQYKDLKIINHINLLKRYFKQKKLSQIIKRYKPKCIFNLAAETHVDRAIDQSDNFIQSNIKEFIIY